MSLYSERHGKGRGYSDADLIDQIWSEIHSWVYQQGLLDEAFGYDINSWLENNKKKEKNKHYEGRYEDGRSFFTRALKYRVDFFYSNYHEGFRSDRENGLYAPLSFYKDIATFYDFLEVLHETVSLPARRTGAYKHIGFDRAKGQELLRRKINVDLSLLPKPMSMLSNGQIVELSTQPVNELVEEATDLSPSSMVTRRTVEPLQYAVSHYVARGASVADKKTAVRNLADVLESLRPKIKAELLSRDESDLFNIANSFAIRHNDSKQKNDYSKDIWYDWMFHVNLAATLTVIRILKAQEES